MKRKAVWAAGALGLVAALGIAACGGSDSPTQPTNPGGTGGPVAATIVIGADGRIVPPANVTVAVGSRVTFTNNHNRVHDMSSDPHPEHTDCPEFRTVGSIAAGQSRTTENLVTARRCGFHDHLNPDDAGLRGSITVQ